METDLSTNNPTSPNSVWSLDGIVIVVSNLEEAVRDYTALGFTVIRGGAYPDGFAHVAVIPLTDGTYFVMYALQDPSMIHHLQNLKKQNQLDSFKQERKLHAMDCRFVDHLIDGPGLADFSISPSKTDLDSEIATLKRKNLQVSGPITMTRQLPNGRNAQWEIGVPLSPELPNLISDATPRSLRIGGNPPILQGNGATGVARLTVAVSDLEQGVHNYHTLLRQDPSERTTTALEKTAVFALGSVTLVLAQPIDNNTHLADYLKTQGPGLYAMELWTDNRSYIGALDRSKTHGANINLIQRPNQ